MSQSSETRIREFLQGEDRPTRRRILSVSAGALTTGLAGCSAVNLGETSGLSSPDQTALEEYSDSYETVQEAKEKYENGIETFRENVGTNGSLEDFPSDWPELQEQMLTAEKEFSDASGGFNQASRSASSSIIESGCDIAVEWVEPHIEVAEFFGDLGGPSEEFVDNSERKISNRPAPLDPETLRERAVSGEDLNVTPAGTPTNTPDSTPDSSPDHRFNSPPYESVETEERGATTTVSGEITLEAGEYAEQVFRPDKQTQIQITGSTEGEGEIDLFVLSSDREFEKYSEGDGGDISGEFTKTNFRTIEQTVEVSPGEYSFVFDNSAVYGAEPQGTVTFEFEIVSQTSSWVSPSQPKIAEVQDNFGHTFTFSRDASDSVRVDDEVVVSDETVVKLCVTDVAAESDDEISYSYTFLGDRDHPDNPEETKLGDNCWEWDMRRNDYQSQWGYRIWVSNDDDIYYHNNSNETDYSADIYYTNLRLEN
jgi:hypothetical protein